MVHPIVAAVGIGVAFGAAIFMLFMQNENTRNNNRQQNTRYRERPHPLWRNPMGDVSEYE